MIDNKKVMDFDSKYDDLSAQAEVYNLVRTLAKSRLGGCGISKSAAEGHAWLELVKFSDGKLNEVNDRMDRLLRQIQNEEEA